MRIQAVPSSLEHPTVLLNSEPKAAVVSQQATLLLLPLVHLHQQRQKQSRPLNLVASALGQAHLLLVDNNRKPCLQPQVYSGVAVRVAVRAVDPRLLLDRAMSAQKASPLWPLVRSLPVLLVLLRLQQQHPLIALGLLAEAPWPLGLARQLHLLHHLRSLLERDLSNPTLLHQMLQRLASLVHLPLPPLHLGVCNPALGQERLRPHPVVLPEGLPLVPLRLRLSHHLVLQAAAALLSPLLVVLALQCQRLGARLRREAFLWG